MAKVFKLESVRQVLDLLEGLFGNFGFDKLQVARILLEPSFYSYVVDFHVKDEGSYGAIGIVSVNAFAQADRDGDWEYEFCFSWTTGSGHSVSISGTKMGWNTPDGFSGEVLLGDDPSEYFYAEVENIIKGVISS